MKVVALVSGGKDSCYAMMKCLEYGHEIVALANLLPADDAEDELDSYMYQTIVIGYAKCMGLPLFRRRIQGSTRHHDLSYSTTPGDEVEDMFILLNEVKQQITSVAAVSSGAIASDYQRLRVESVCSRLGLVSLAYLWKQDQSLLLREMIKAGIVAVTVKVAAMGLDPSKHLGKEISLLEHHLHQLKELYGVNVCGEGGEYETLTLDCPLFKNAWIVLDEFQVVLRSADPICPVGILHPLAFHLEKKSETVPSGGGNKNDDVCLEELDLVCEVQGDCQQRCENITMPTYPASKLMEVDNQELQISRTKMDNTFSISCWLQDSSKISSDLQADLVYVLMKIEWQLAECCYSWENVLYIHLYIADMNKFALANETYVRFITQDKCRFGVPSRSTVELPLSQVGLGRAYIEVLVTNDETKRVLHVQSISSWAPSCIGPYSQATLHKDILYMAGQLGLDPPTMLLSTGGSAAELEQALKNCEAVAKCFNCSISTSAILFVIYCSASMNESDRIAIEDKTNTFLKEMKLNDSDSRSSSDVLDPILLYVLVPDLPKRALVEVKPVLYVAGNTQLLADKSGEVISVGQDYCGFKHENWHDECIQKCVVPRRLCAAILSVTQNMAGKICSKFHLQDDAGCKALTEDQIDEIAKFCVYLLDKFLLENCFSWDDVTAFRIYFTISLRISHKAFSLIFTRVFSEFAELNPKRKTTTDPIFNLVPTLAAGRSAKSLNDILSCEVFARKV